MARKLYGKKSDWCALAGSLAIVISSLLFVVRHDSKFGEESFNSIKVGMTEPEVEAILGYPPGDYRPSIWKKPKWFVSPTDVAAWPRKKSGIDMQELIKLQEQDLQEWIQKGMRPSPKPQRVVFKWWWGRRHMIDVAFDDSGRVISHTLSDTVPPRPPHNLFLLVRWWLGW